jgi:hypothetical protein
MDIRAVLLAVVTFFAGFFVFFRGFWIFREYRLVEDTPETSIRSLSMGLVEIHGQAKGDSMLMSPVTCTPCYLYKVEVDRSHRNEKGDKTESHFFTDLNQVSFYLEDDSGKVLVDPCDAELDLARQGMRLFIGEVRFDPAAAKLPAGRMDPERANRRPREDELRTYVSQVASQRNVISASTHLDDFDDYTLEEYCIVPGVPYDITGTCVENPKPADEHDRNMIVKGQNERTFLISSKTKKDIQTMLRRRAVKYIAIGATLSVASLAFLIWMFS